MNAVLLALGVLGLALAIYLTRIFVRVRRGDAVRCWDETCPLVMKTTYATALGFPNGWLAIPFYAAVTLFAALRLAGLTAWMFWPVAGASVLSLMMSVYLVYALLVKLKQNCPLCMLGHALNIAIAVVLLMLWRAAR